MSFLTQEPPWFAFIAHPRDVGDIISMPGGTFLRDHSADETELISKAASSPPIVVSDITFLGSSVRGELIGVGRLPAALLSPDGHRAVVEAVELAVRRGAPVIGLGALTAPATAGGRALLRQVPRNVALTNGNGFTAAVIHRNVQEAADWLGLGTAARVSVVGATGSVGVPLSHLLVDSGFEPTLIGTSERQIERRLGDLLARGARGALGFDALAHAHVVVLLTSDPSARLPSEATSEGAVVIDVAQPPNIEEDYVPRFAARDVVVRRGGTVDIRGYACRHGFGLSAHHQTFACLAETYLLACEGIREHSVGRPSAAYARRLEAIAERHGVTIPSLLLTAARDAVETAFPRAARAAETASIESSGG